MEKGPENVSVSRTLNENLTQAELVLIRMLDVTKSSNNLPKLGEKFELYSSYAVFSNLLESEGRRLKDLMNQLLRYYGTKVSISGSNTLDEIVEILEKASDVLAERIANSIDEADGKRKQEDIVLISESSLPGERSTKPIINTSWNKQFNPTDESSLGASSVLQHNAELKLMACRNVPRPQLEFQTLIDNSNRPFACKLNFKHNACATCQASNFRLFVDGTQHNLTPSLDYNRHPNPYQYELDHFVPTDNSLLRIEVVSDPPPICDTKLEFVESEEALQKLNQHLKNCSEFAVDLEHHAYRTFQGITCLMQISTRCTDYIIDTLRLWKSMHLLNDPFTDPKIVKVFHGADKDVEWLQRDFGIYVVNMFDTGQAMRVLGMARFSLAHLVKSYVGKDLDKQFQLADWRIRPLPQQLIEYAREDTHFLLFCYEKLKNELLDSGNDMQNLLISVFERSRDICSKHYEKPLFDAELDYIQLIAQWKKPLNSRQKLALKGLFAWRDATARAQDESLAFVLPNHMLLQMAEVLPREMQGLLSCCNPVPPLVKQHLQHLHGIVLNARQSPLLTTLACEGTERGHQCMSVNHRIVAKPHDFSHCDEEEEVAPIMERLLADGVVALNGPLTTKQRPTVTFVTCGPEINSTLSSYPTPYELYLQSLVENVPPQLPCDPSPGDHSHLSNGVAMKLEIDSLIDEKYDTKKRKCVEAIEENESSDEETVSSVLDDALCKRGKKKIKKKKFLVENVKSFDYSIIEPIARSGATRCAENSHFDPHSWRDVIAH